MSQSKIIRPVAINDAVLIASNVPESRTIAEWDAGATYAVGVYVVKSLTHRRYRSLVAGNIGHDPGSEADPANPVYWQDVGATDRWMMFDDKTGSQTSNPDAIDVTLLPGERYDSVALFNLAATTVQVTMTDPVEGVVFDETIALTSASGIGSWYDYFFEPVVRKSQLTVTGMPLYINATLDIVITNAAGDAMCGECVIGQSRTIGAPQYGARVGIQDYSIKQADEFGDYSVLERSFADRAQFTLWVDRVAVNELRRLFAQYRATPLVWVMVEGGYDVSIYGFFKDFDIDIAYADVALCNIELEGLT